MGGLAVGGPARIGNIETDGDMDIFRIRLVQGQRYAFNLNAESSGRGTNPDPYLELFRPNGALILADDDTPGSFDAQILYRATATGFYYLAAQSYGFNTGTYQLRAVRRPNRLDNEAEDSATAPGSEDASMPVSFLPDPGLDILI